MNNKLSNLSFLAGALLIGVSQANATQSYTFTDLGSGNALAINKAGQVAGSSYDIAVVWNGTTTTSFFDTNGSTVAINNSGQVAINESGPYGGALDLFNSTTPTSLGYGYGPYSHGYAINNTGQVAASIQGYAVVVNETGILINLGRGVARGINDVGQVAGFDSNGNGTVWTLTGHGTTVTDLGGYAYPAAINNAGQVVGMSFADDWTTRSTLWTLTGNGVTKTILGSGWVNAINNAGVVVGQSRNDVLLWSLGIADPDSVALLWNGTTATDLNGFLTVDEINAGWTLNSANGINDSGSIVGQSYNTITYAYDAFLLTPDDSVGAVPEPETYALMLAGLGALGFVARRRKLR